MYDILVKNGLVIDPSQGMHAKKDIAFYQERVAAIDDEIDAEPGKDALQVMDACGRIITPGIIDLHVHVRSGYKSLDPDCLLISGATANFDAGTYGANNISQIRYLANKSKSMLYAWLNISSIGLGGRPELEIMEYGDVGRAVEACQRNRDLIKGIKCRLTLNALGNSNPIEALHLAKEAAKKAGLPVHVHGIRTDQKELLRGIGMGDILAELRKGDIHTHTYARYSGIVDENGHVIPEAQEAIDKGVILDVGHGSGSFHWQVAEKCLKAGVGPQTISTDLHTASIMGPAFDMATTMSKYLSLGYTLDEVVDKATFAPAKAVGMEDVLGTLRIGAWANATILQLERGEFVLYDSYGNQRTGREILTPKATICKGVTYIAGSWRDTNWIWPPKWREVPPLP